MRAWVSTSVDWMKSRLSTLKLSPIWTKLSSLASKLLTGVAAPLKALATGVGSLITTFLSGNWVAVLVHPITLTVLAFTLGMGWAYSKGQQHERRAQAAAIIDLNNRVKSWKQAYEQSDEKAEMRLQAALESWRRSSGARVVTAAQCKVDKVTAETLADIAGD